MAAALMAQELTTVSDPEPVILDGHHGVYLTLTAPTDISFENCASGYYGGPPFNHRPRPGLP
jgi:hypothetical protein